MNLSVANKIVCLCDLPLEVEDAPGALAVDDEVGVEHHQALDSLPALEAAGVNIESIECLNFNGVLSKFWQFLQNSFFLWENKRYIFVKSIDPFLEGAVNDEELADQGIEQDGLVVVCPGRGKLVVRRKLQTDHEALHLGVHLAGQVRGHHVKCDEGVGA